MKTVPAPALQSQISAATVDLSTYGFRIPFLHFKKSFIHFIVVVIALLFCLHAVAQPGNSHRKENYDVRKFEVELVDIADPVYLITLKNISRITLVDARADTAAIGFMQKKTIEPFLGSLNNATQNQTEQRVNRRPTFIALDNGLQQEAKQYAERSIVFNTDTTLPDILMVLKKFWLTDELNFDKLPREAATFSGPASKDIWTSGVDVKIEFYLHDNAGYYPLYRYDTVISEQMTVSEYAPGYIANALGLSLQKMQQMDDKISSIKMRRKFTLEEINQHNENEFNIPVLTENGFKKGVYMSFEEFKNNNPSQIEYEIKQDKLTDVVYIKQAGGIDYPARNVWGYCDGQNAFIRSANNFFLLQRNANAFYIFGAKHIKRNETSSSGVASSYSGTSMIAVPYNYRSARTFVQLEPFQLDWSTGKLY